MIFGSLVTAIFLTIATFAAPDGSIARRSRRSTTLQSKPVEILSENVGLTGATDIVTANVPYTPNWAGAVWDSYPPNTFYKITGTFTVPIPRAPNGKASIWVGIDGATCKYLLQTGIYVYYNNGAISYDSWFEWYPSDAYRYNNPIAIRAGDSLRLTVTVLSTTSATTLIENLTTGLSESSPPLSYPSYPLCLQNAEWIVEDPSFRDSVLAPFCNFGTITFSSASAYLRNGRVISPDGAAAVNIKQNGIVLTSVAGGPPGTVTITYV